MKKFINILGAAAIVLGGVTSCTLDAVNYVEKTPENFPITSDDASQALAGIYENLNQVSANPQMSFFYLSMLASDDNLGGGGTNDKLMQAMDLLLNYQTNMTHQFWSDRYQGINRANSLLAGVENMALEDGERNQVIGEANLCVLSSIMNWLHSTAVFLWYFQPKKLNRLNLQLPSCGDKS